jgi:hypothetical protein
VVLAREKLGRSPVAQTGEECAQMEGGGGYTWVDGVVHC